MNKNILEDANEMLSSFDKNKKLWDDFYSQPFYNNNTNNINLTQQSPEGLVPHGSNARVVNNGPVEHQADLLKPLEDVSANPTAKWDNIFKSTEYLKPLQDEGKEILNGITPESKGFDIAGAGIGAAKFGLSAMNSVSGTDSSEKESWAKTANLTMQGAQAGMAFGPIGAGVGAGVGAITGLINMGSDQRARNRKIRKDNLTQAQQESRDRLRDYEIENAKKEIENMTALSKSQLNYIK